MRQYWDIGALVLMIIEILKEIAWFLIILLIGIIGITNAFAVLGSAEGFEHDGQYCSLHFCHMRRTCSGCSSNPS